ncbi:MAG: peptide ABC transporter substrate-binding protein [Arcobacter sp.]|uniref:peptide-binding protein n=1 Tax=uncultured Arcobacter sp. TaxID=165434 RepID=UPI000CAF7105|nr:peptide-binding protein [uncultured Arcobacter sp.]PLY10103.1 MAG: peptide ABC transporter substrate-binding protein [Arcobacter sp.]
MKKFLLLFIIHCSLFTCLNASTLNLSISSSPSRINPILASDSASSEITQWLFNGLFKYDKNGNIVPELASSYKFISKTHLIINLRDDVLWHDGEKFSADDVIFTYNKIHDPKVFTAIKSNYKEVESISKINDFTLEIIYKKPYFKALEIWMTGILPKHLLKDEEDLMKSDFNKQPIGTGAYKLDSFKVGSDIRLFAFDKYFEGRPKIDEINYKFLPDPTTSFLFLKQNRLDVGGLTPLQVDRQIDKEFLDDFQLIERPAFAYAYLGFNLNNKKFKDLNVRKALSLAINRKEIVDILFFGHGQVCNGPFLPGTFAYDKDIKVIKQDLKQAKRLLKLAGYDENNPLSFEVITNTGNETRLNATQIIQYQLAKIGVKMKIRVMEWQAFLNTVVHPRNFEAIVLGWNLAVMPDAYPLWHSDSRKTGAFNLVGYSNKEVDELIVKGSTTVDKEELGKIYRKIFNIIANDTPYLFLYIPNSITSVSKKIQNIEPSFLGIMHNQNDWIKEDD